MKGARMMKKIKTVTDLFQEHLGAHEYDSFVTKMIKWYNDGGFAKVAWCAISMSYMMNQLGLLDQIGGKNQNCYRMLVSTAAANKKTGKGKLLYRKDLKPGDVIKRGSIIFILKSAAPMTEGSDKHVTSAYEDFVYNGSGWFDALGGNQSDYIQVKKYGQKNIYAVFVPDYTEEHRTLRKGDSGPEVKELQEDLTALGFGRITGTRLACRGNFKNNTYNALCLFQKYTGLAVDGVCGPKTRAKINAMLSAPVRMTTALTNVFTRTGPGADFRKTGKVLEGDTAGYTNIVNGWLYIPSRNSWSRSSYFKL